MGAFSLSPAAGGLVAPRQRLAITVDKCCDWLQQQLPHEYSNMSC